MLTLHTNEMHLTCIFQKKRGYYNNFLIIMKYIYLTFTSTMKFLCTLPFNTWAPVLTAFRHHFTAISCNNPSCNSFRFCSKCLIFVDLMSNGTVMSNFGIQALTCKKRGINCVNISFRCSCAVQPSKIEYSLYLEN